MEHNLRPTHPIPTNNAERRNQVGGNLRCFQALNLAALVADEVRMQMFDFRILPLRNGIEPATVFPAGPHAMHQFFSNKSVKRAIDRDRIDATMALQTRQNLRHAHGPGDASQNLNHPHADGRATQPDASKLSLSN